MPTANLPASSIPGGVSSQKDDSSNPDDVNADRSNTSRDTLRVLLVDDHAIVREGLAMLINAQPDMQVVAQATDGDDAILQAQNAPADIVVMDIAMPQKDGLSATRHIKERFPELKLLALSIHDDASSVRQMLEAGASGYVLKRSASVDLVQALRVVARGATYLDPLLTAQIINRFMQSEDAERHAETVEETTPGDLSERETDVLRRTAQGYSSKEIATQLSVMVKTVETYKRRAMDKLSLSSRVDIVRYAARQGWFSD